MGAVILLIVLGIILFIIEFLLIPGITIAAIGAALLTASGIILAFHRFGTKVGVIVLLFTLVSSVAIFALSLRARTWKRAMLHTNSDSKVADELGFENIREGDRGVTVGRMAPMGTIRVNDHTYEASSVSGYIDPGTEIEILKIRGSSITVKTLKQ
jgi:membrane-bound ClpP family serine protease